MKSSREKLGKPEPTFLPVCKEKDVPVPVFPSLFSLSGKINKGDKIL
jgi:hypothetical protein